MKLVRLKKLSTGLRVSSFGGALLTLALAPSCGGGATEDLTQPDVSPTAIFETQAKPDLVQACANCHDRSQGSVDPFLATGMEYQSITGYQQGKFINVPAAVQSVLLTKGPHTGPAFTPEQYAKVQGWIEAEIVSRPSNTPGMMKSALLPTAPITPGDFNMNFGNQDPINDPQANITFTLAPDSSSFYRVSKLTITAGPTTGIHIKHPKFYFITNTASFADPADSLGIVDLSVPANGSMTIGSGTVLLTNAPTNDPNTRIGIAFETLEKSQVQPVMVACKDFKDFNPALVNDLKGCAATCHGGRNGAATSAYDMTLSTSTDMAKLMSFCISSLGRINKTTPNKSILLLQAIPQAQGGTPNHPFKYSLAADITRFTNEVTTWAAGEK